MRSLQHQRPPISLGLLGGRRACRRNDPPKARAGHLGFRQDLLPLRPRRWHGARAAPRPAQRSNRQDRLGLPSPGADPVSKAALPARQPRRTMALPTRQAREAWRKRALRPTGRQFLALPEATATVTVAALPGVWLQQSRGLTFGRRTVPVCTGEDATMGDEGGDQRVPLWRWRRLCRGRR